MSNPETDFAFIKNVTSINHKPHPFTVGTRHVVEASEHHGGILGEEVMRKIACAHRNCTLSYDQHTSDKVALVQQKRNCTTQEMQTWLKNLVEAGWATEVGIDGFVFLDTPEHYRIQN